MKKVAFSLAAIVVMMLVGCGGGGSASSGGTDSTNDVVSDSSVVQDVQSYTDSPDQFVGLPAVPQLPEAN